MTTKLPLSIKQLIELDACVRCECCRDQCPVYVASPEDDPIDFPQSYAGLIKKFNSMVKSQYGIRALLFGGKKPKEEDLKQFSRWMYNCTLCGKCGDFCPLLIETHELGISIRKWIIENNQEPEKFRLIKNAIDETKNVLNMDNDDREMWADFLDKPVNIYEEGSKAETIYFVGCMISFSPTLQDTAAAFTEILNNVNEDYIILGPDEWCCGYPLHIAGYEEGLQELLEHNVEIVKKVGAKKVVFSCPSCYLMWKKYYVKELPDVRLLHEVEFLDESIKEGKIKLNNLNMRVTYHDPCDLGRKLRIFEPPRDVIKSIPGIDFKELPLNRADAWCCGGGGDVEIADETLPGKVAKLTFDEVEEVEADALITACGACKRTFLNAKRQYGKKFRVIDIGELVLESMQKET